MKIGVRPVYRALGILICLGMIITVFSELWNQSYDRGDAVVMIIILVTVFPLILSSCILGHIPEVITKDIPQELEEDFLKSERMFTRSWKDFLISTICFFVIAG